jgi:ribonuclease HII
MIRCPRESIDPMEPFRSPTTSRLYDFDRTVTAQTGSLIVGIDEAGRGPLAGPVVAAAVVLDLDTVIDGINDSKKVPANKREALYERIVSEARFWAVGEASVEEIDRVNILRATFLAMQRAFDKCAFDGPLALIDGNQRLPSIATERQQTVVGGDGKSASIAAASIVAKVTRDRIMRGYHERYPHYDLLSNKGYGTEVHRRCIAEYGLTEIHRRTFCEKFVTQTVTAL